MEEKSLLEEMCDLVFEKAQPQTESYKQKRSNAAEAGERLHKSLTDEQKQLLEERDDALGRCASEERLLMFKLTLRLAFALLKEMGETK